MVRVLDKIKCKGMWFFGLSGSGKTYLSNKLFKKKKKAFLIDGDKVRELKSYDLGYSKFDRVKQNKRVLGLAKIVIKNGYFPIVSSVYMDPEISIQIKKIKIKLFQVVAPENKINKKLSNKKNVVGKKIKQPKIKCEVYKTFDKS